jgi:hypothetical protein
MMAKRLETPKTKSAGAADFCDRKRGFSTASTPELSRRVSGRLD